MHYAGAILPVSWTDGNRIREKFNCYFPDQIGLMQLHESKFTQCAFPSARDAEAGAADRARVGEFVRWYNSFASVK